MTETKSRGQLGLRSDSSQHPGCPRLLRLERRRSPLLSFALVEGCPAADSARLVLWRAGNMLSFLVGKKQAFEISIADVSQTQMQGKNDVMLQFHVDDTTGEVSRAWPWPGGETVPRLALGWSLSAVESFEA